MPNLAALLPLAAITPAEVAFWLLAGVATISGFLVIWHRNPVVEALFLVVNLVAVAGLFVYLDAPFLAVLQVFIYAGAIVVLIVFVIMLLNLAPEARGGPGSGSRVLAFALGLILVVMIARAVLHFAPPESGELTPGYGSAANLGSALFNRYFYPFEAVSLALVAAMVGSVLLAKRNLED